MEVMRAWRSDGRGDLWLSTQADDLSDHGHRNEPADEQGSVLVAVEAASICSVDLGVVNKAPMKRLKPPFTPGRQVAGVVLGGPGFQRGTRVVGTTCPGLGAWAERAVAKPQGLMTVPKGVSAEDALALYIPGQTAALALWQRARVAAGEIVIIHDPVSSVGAIALQLAARSGARVIAVAEPTWHQRIVELGAHDFVDGTDPDWVDSIERQYGAVDVVVDLMGTAPLEQSVRLLGFDGRVVVAKNDQSASPVDSTHLAARAAAVLGVSWSAYRRQRPEVLEKAASRLFDLLRNAHLNPAVHRRVEFGDIGEAVTELSANGISGTTLVAVNKGR